VVSRANPRANERAAALRTWLGCAFAAILLAAGCARLPDTGVTPFKAQTLTTLQRHVLEGKPSLDQFRPRGPFEVSVQEDLQLVLSPKERIEVDLYRPAHAEPAPLVILLHGYGNSKEDHAYQAYHIASWGLYGVSIQLPPEGPWLRNGRTLARIVNLLSRRPELLDRRVDPRRIVLAGHSFGGYAVTIALAEGAPAAGAVLLDPAGLGRSLTTYLRKIRKPPVMVLASDARVNVMRQRESFYENIGGEVAEISVMNAHHEDAQFPMLDGMPGAGTYWHATEEHQITFAAALTAAALSLGFTEKLDFAWANYMEGVKTGRLYDALRR
jgi:pimeloyl-ACP methyl ester carboxylesterase